MVAKGRKYITPDIAQMLAESLTQPVSESPHEKLSDRELQTLVLIASGRRLSDIAAELTLSRSGAGGPGRTSRCRACCPRP